MKFSCLSFRHQSISQNIGYCFASLLLHSCSCSCAVCAVATQLLMSSRWLLFFFVVVVVALLAFISFIRVSFVPSSICVLLLLKGIEVFVSQKLQQAHSVKAKKNTMQRTHQTLNSLCNLFAYR